MPRRLPGPLLAGRFHHGRPRGGAVRLAPRRRGGHGFQSAGRRLRRGLPRHPLHGRLLAQTLRPPHRDPGGAGRHRAAGQGSRGHARAGARARDLPACGGGGRRAGGPGGRGHPGPVGPRGHRLRAGGAGRRDVPAHPRGTAGPAHPGDGHRIPRRPGADRLPVRPRRDAARRAARHRLRRGGRGHRPRPPGAPGHPRREPGRRLAELSARAAARRRARPRRGRHRRRGRGGGLRPGGPAPRRRERGAHLPGAAR